MRRLKIYKCKYICRLPFRGFYVFCSCYTNTIETMNRIDTLCVQSVKKLFFLLLIRKQSLKSLNIYRYTVHFCSIIPNYLINQAKFQKFMASTIFNCYDVRTLITISVSNHRLSPIHLIFEMIQNTSKSYTIHEMH